MKNLLFMSLFFISYFAQGQFSENTTHAFERTAYKRWDEFNPKWFWEFFDAVSKNNYMDEDKRTMYARAKQMSEWAIYMDHFKNLEHQTDSVYKAEQYKAIDRTLNKTWLLVQKPIVKKLREHIDKALATSLDVVEDVKLVESFNDSYDTSLEKIDIVLKAYVSDAKKEEKINGIIKELNGLLSVMNFVNFMESLNLDREEKKMDFKILLEKLKDDYNRIFPLEINNNSN